ncbi:MAG: arylsulfatase A-like enzyme [Akkermansiaceae bacterium]|jgi:arylsulfatase A-like enzyme
MRIEKINSEFMKHILIFCHLIASCCFSAATDRPNILWIVSEDNSSHWLGCYGNKDAQTPQLDALAAGGTRFTAAYSNAPVCAVARATILMGRYSPSMGTQHMRSRHPIPSNFTPYVSHLRKAGYYTSNASKTDYNFKGNDTKLWDDSSRKAHYKNRPEGKPFFSIFNLTVSHESNLFPAKIAGNRKRGLIPQIPRLDPTKLTLPPYLPDLPEMRHDFAVYHDTMTALDTQIGGILTRLKKDGLADDTIIFYYGDHGGPTPRGKRYLHDTGVRIPMIVHVPEKWAKLSPFKNGQVSDEVVAFVDLAPTLLSLAGLKDDPNMQGRPFLGPNRVEPAKDHLAFLFADRFDEIYGLRRGLTDGRYKYVRHFTPHIWTAPYSFYQFQMASWPAWQKAWKGGKLSGVQSALWESDQPTEEFYDTQTDPWEIKNLANDPAYTKPLEAMRAALKAKMAEIRDTAVVPEPLFAATAGKQAIATAVSAKTFPFNELLDLAFIASARDEKHLIALQEAAQSQNPVKRYWGLSGLVTLGDKAAPAKALLTKALTDSETINRAQAAHALSRIDEKELALKTLIDGLNNEALPNLDQALIVNTLMQMREAKSVPESWIKRAKKNKGSNPRLGTLAASLKLL